MSNDDKILKILESMDKRLEQQGKDIADVKQAQASTNTAIKALATKQDVETAEERLTTRIEAARAEVKVDNLHLQGKLDKVIKHHERWLEAIGEKTGVTNPSKN